MPIFFIGLPISLHVIFICSHIIFSFVFEMHAYELESVQPSGTFVQMAFEQMFNTC